MNFIGLEKGCLFIDNPFSCSHIFLWKISSKYTIIKNCMKNCLKRGLD